MNGGTFNVGEVKERAGIYFRFTAVAQERISSGVRGRVAIPLVLGWGEPKKVIEISDVTKLKSLVGIPFSDPSLRLFREAKKNADTVLLYRVNEGEKAAAVLGTSGSVTARYGGAEGNNIRISVIANVLDETKFDVITYVGEKEEDRQTVESYKELQSNAYVEFGGTGAVELAAGVKLEGGSNGTPSNEDYMDFLSAIESEHFDVVAFPVEEEELNVAFTSFIKRLRDNQGYKVQGVAPKNPANYEGIINVTNGVRLESGEVIPVEQAVAWAAGASAGVTLKQSNTFTIYEGAVDAEPRFDDEEIRQRLKNGEFFFTYDGRDKTVAVELDINSLRTSSNFRKNKVIRILDAMNNDITREFKRIIQDRKATGEDIPVNDDGVQIVRTAVVLYLSTFFEEGIIDNFDSEDDVKVSITDQRDGFYVNVGVQPVDSAEKFYFDVEVR